MTSSTPSRSCTFTLVLVKGSVQRPLLSTLVRFCYLSATMWPKPSLLLQSLALHIAYANAQAVSTVAYGPNGVCPAPPTTITSVLVQPVFYSQFIQSASVINNVGCQFLEMSQGSDNF